MADRYNNLNNTAPEVDPLKQKKPSIDKSDFDLGQALYFKALDGMIIPFWHLRVIPSSSIDLSINIRAIMTNPYVKQLLSGKRAYVHVYHSNLSDLWEGAPELLKKGRDFNTKLKIPTLKRILNTKINNNNRQVITTVAGAPSSYLGMPVQLYNRGTQSNPATPLDNIKPALNDEQNVFSQLSNYGNFEFSCLPLVMYQQIYQAHYLNKNLVNSNTDWLPQVENHFILPLEASGQEIAQLSYDVNQAKNFNLNDNSYIDFNDELFVPRNVDSDHPQTASNKPFLNIMRFRQFKGDMFTSGSPFPDLLRGDVPVMSFADLTGTIDWSKVFSSTNLGEGIALPAFVYNDQTPEAANYGKLFATTNFGDTPTNNSVATTALQNILNKAVVNVQNQLSFNLNALRALDVYTLLGERAARTDGTYNNYIKTMFNVDPRYHMHEPRYLGGFYLDFVNQTIEQNSESNTTPLGTTASRGIASGSGHIGKFSFNDHGYLMAVLDIVDETIYTGGVDRDWTDLTFEDQYLPLFNGLAPQATRVQELYLSGVKGINEKPFNYVERYSHLKSRRNKALGQMSLPAYDTSNNPIDLESASYIHTRRFTSEPTFNNLWVSMTPKNIDMTPYTSVNDYPFLVTAQTSVDAVLPLPYITVPSGLAIMA